MAADTEVAMVREFLASTTTRTEIRALDYSSSSRSCSLRIIRSSHGDVYGLSTRVENQRAGAGRDGRI